jgi:hypothetical protein
MRKARRYKTLRTHSIAAAVHETAAAERRRISHRNGALYARLPLFLISALTSWQPVARRFAFGWQFCAHPATRASSR